MAYFSIVMSTFIVFIYYRAQMNAVLNVKVLDYDIETWQDILDSSLDVLIHLGMYIQT